MTGTFAQFQRRVEVTGILVTETGLHIGGAASMLDPTTNDNPVVRLADGRPYIPGSSLRGVLRAFLERLYASGGGWLRSPGASEERCIHRMSADEVRRLKERHSNNPTGLAQAMWEQLCPICRLFGNTHFAGRLLIADLLPASKERIPLQRRHGVAIDRDTHTASSGALYTLEAVAPESRFDFTMLLENPTDEQVYDALLAVWALKKGEVALGAKTGSGMGRVRLEEGRVRDYTAHDLLAAAWDDAYATTPLEDYLTQIGVTGPVRRVSRKAVLDALSQLGEQVTWAEAQELLHAAFGGDRAV